MSELYIDHPDELQIWATRTRPPHGQGIAAWAGYLLSLAIRTFTFRYGGRYSHVLLRYGHRIWEAGPGGIREAFAAEYRTPSAAVDVFALHADWWQVLKIISWAEDAIGTPYDFPQIARLALIEIGLDPNAYGIPDLADRALICSEFVAIACQRGGIDLIGGLPLDRFTPDHILAAARRGIVEPRGRLIWS